ncbi:MAG: hypothetical protein J5728_08380 [Lachnospiraceae bacterium]|nr:hypothetical protein [Lachnospiraceae bacterium]
MNINRKYKDRLFRMLFGTEENKDNILSLYNALHGTDYNDADAIELRTIEDAIYIGMKNDVSFLIGNELSLWEQQSTYNPNMPLRGFIYYGKLYDAYVSELKTSMYGTVLLQLPVPNYVVLFNGSTDCPAVEKMRLSDAFMGGSDSGEYEWTATVYNLNGDKNRRLLEACKPLADYSEVVRRINSRIRKGMTKEEVIEAVDEAVRSCIEDGILSEFLTRHRAEVIDVCITEFDEKKYVDSIREEGRAEGLLIGKVKVLTDMVADGIITLDEAAGRADMTIEDFTEYLKKHN